MIPYFSSYTKHMGKIDSCVRPLNALKKKAKLCPKPEYLTIRNLGDFDTVTSRETCLFGHPEVGARLNSAYSISHKSSDLSSCPLRDSYPIPTPYVTRGCWTSSTEYEVDLASFPGIWYPPLASGGKPGLCTRGGGGGLVRFI